MENTTLHNISLAQFRGFFPDAKYIGIGDDFYMLDIALQEKHQPLNHPCRFDGFMLLYCIKGRGGVGKSAILRNVGNWLVGELQCELRLI